MNIYSMLTQIAELPNAGCNDYTALQIAQDAFHFFSLRPPHETRLLGREKHHICLPRTVMRTHELCVYLLQTKGKAELIGFGSSSKVGRVIVIHRKGQVELKCGKSIFAYMESALFGNNAAISYQSPNVIPPAEFACLYISEVKNKKRLLFVSEEFAFDAFSKEMRGLLPQCVLSIAKDAATGLAIIHEHQEVHNDLKPENLFIRFHPEKVGWNRYEGVVGDLGLLGKCGDKDRYPRGAPLWWAPEVVQSNFAVSTIQKDIWAFGIVLYQLFKKKESEADDGFPPFVSRMEFKSIQNLQLWPHFLKHLKEQEIVENLFPKGWSILPFDLEIEQIILQCLSINPLMRPTAKELSSRLREGVDRLYPE